MPQRRRSSQIIPPGLHEATRASAQPDTIHSDSALLAAEDLVVSKGLEPLSFSVRPGLTVLCNHRENHTTALALTLAGRRREVSGRVLLAAPGSDSGDGLGIVPGPLEPTGVRRRFTRVALAGVPEIDSLERQVPVRESIREQVAWSLPWYRRAPKDILNHSLVAPWVELLSLEELDPRKPAGELDVVNRFLVRVLLALVARPRAELLIVDDLDQLRDMSLRAWVLHVLARLSGEIPVIAQSVNPERPRECDFIELDSRASARLGESETEKN